MILYLGFQLHAKMTSMWLLILIVHLIKNHIQIVLRAAREHVVCHVFQSATIQVLIRPKVLVMHMVWHPIQNRNTWKLQQQTSATPPATVTIGQRSHKSCM